MLRQPHRLFNQLLDRIMTVLSCISRHLDGDRAADEKSFASRTQEDSPPNGDRVVARKYADCVVRENFSLRIVS